MDSSVTLCMGSKVRLTLLLVLEDLIHAVCPQALSTSKEDVWFSLFSFLMDLISS